MLLCMEATHHKAKAFLEIDVSDAAVALEEPLHILLSGCGAQPADENTTPAHDRGFGRSFLWKKKSKKKNRFISSPFSIHNTKIMLIEDNRLTYLFSLLACQRFGLANIFFV